MANCLELSRIVYRRVNVLLRDSRNPEHGAGAVLDRHPLIITILAFIKILENSHIIVVIFSYFFVIFSNEILLNL